MTGERFKVHDMEAALLNATVHADRFETIDLMADAHPARPERTYTIHTSPQADELMQQLNTQEEWIGFLSELNAALKADDQIAQNTRGKSLAARFNSDCHQSGKLRGWKVTFATRFWWTGPRGTHDGTHHLLIEPASSTKFYEHHVGKGGNMFGRICCCKWEDVSERCKYSWEYSRVARYGRCCKFKYGDTDRYGCKMSWVTKSDMHEEDNSKCSRGPAVPSFPGWKYAEFDG